MEQVRTRHRHGRPGGLACGCEGEAHQANSLCTSHMCWPLRTYPYTSVGSAYLHVMCVLALRICSSCVCWPLRICEPTPPPLVMCVLVRVGVHVCNANPLLVMCWGARRAAAHPAGGPPGGDQSTTTLSSRPCAPLPPACGVSRQLQTAARCWPSLRGQAGAMVRPPPPQLLPLRRPLLRRVVGVARTVSQRWRWQWAACCRAKRGMAGSAAGGAGPGHRLLHAVALTTAFAAAAVAAAAAAVAAAAATATAAGAETVAPLMLRTLMAASQALGCGHTGSG